MLCQGGRRAACSRELTGAFGVIVADVIQSGTEVPAPLFGVRRLRGVAPHRRGWRGFQPASGASRQLPRKDGVIAAGAIHVATEVPALFAVRRRRGVARLEEGGVDFSQRPEPQGGCHVRSV